MSTQHTPELFARATAFYEKQPTGQYDNEAAHALRCHHELLEALKAAVKTQAYKRGSGPDWWENAHAAIAKATGAAA